MDGWMDGWIHILQRIPPRRWHKIDRYGYGSPIYLYHYFYRNASCLSNSWASCCILQCYYIGNGAKYDKSYYCSFIGNRIRRFDWRPWRTLKDDINGLKGSSIAGTKMIPPPSNKAPQTPSHLPHPTTMRYSNFLDFSWGPVPKVWRHSTRVEWRHAPGTVRWCSCPHRQKQESRRAGQPPRRPGLSF